MNPALFIFLLLSLIIWIYRSIRSLSELTQAPILHISGNNQRHGNISILIPAKNEEKNIADCVRPFLSQLGENDEVIVINNCSTDRTEEILKTLGAKEITKTSSYPTAMLKYLNTPQTPEGWTGKNYALHLGKDYAKGDWLLFTDADTRHASGSVNASVEFAEKNALDLLTLLPRCLAHGFWENVIQPCAMGYMGLWFPVAKINNPRSRVYFGNGQYLLVKHSHYRAFGGHASVKEAFLEDFAMMKQTKAMGARGMCGFGMEIYGTRMYDSFGALWRGWRRIYLHAFEQNPVKLFESTASVLLFSVVPFTLFPFIRTTIETFLSVTLAAIILATAFKTHSIVKANKTAAIFHPLAALIFTAILIDALQMAVFKKKTFWR